MIDHLSGSAANDLVAQSHPRRARAAVLVGLGLVPVGAAVGALWVWLAPPVHGVVALNKSGERVHAYLGAEADHFFVAAVMLLGMLSALAVIAAVAAWQWRDHRGPVLVTAVSVGSALAALAAAGVGTGLARMRYGVIDYDAAPVTPENRVSYFTEAPSVFFGHTPAQMAATVLVPAAVGALVYALLAAAAARDDLGAYPPQDSGVTPVPIPVTADDALPPVR